MIDISELKKDDIFYKISDFYNTDILVEKCQVIEVDYTRLDKKYSTYPHLIGELKYYSKNKMIKSLYTSDFKNCFYTKDVALLAAKDLELTKIIEYQHKIMVYLDLIAESQKKIDDLTT